MFHHSNNSTSSSRSSSRSSGFGKSKFGRSKSNYFSRTVAQKPAFGQSGARGGRSNFSRSAGKSTLNIDSFINKTTAKQIVTEFHPEHQFTDFGLDKVLEEIVNKKGYSNPTPIQDKTIPFIMAGRDVVGMANTGTGKTAAFLLPLIHKINHQRHERILILTPTRELALQINQEFKSFTYNLGMHSVVCVGGTNINPQIRELRLHHQFVIGTPGRVLDLMQRGVLRLDDVKTIVLDEADCMLDMGFIKSIRFVISKMPQPRQTLFFSATMSSTIKKLIDEFLHEPMTVSVDTQTTPTNIEQDIVQLRGRDRVDVLHDLLQDPTYKKVLVFGRTKHGVEKLSKVLLARGIKVESIHGNKSHGGRQRSLKQFKEGAVQVLVATDVAARGLDISNVSHVINYELPESREDYIHRIGRTGRGICLGKALTFIS
ncbi:MAG: DEAD/DEAH box helicase [Patescibacteria group bacterium]|jgi:superfamily II DNA/RNA helicase